VAVVDATIGEEPDRLLVLVNPRVLKTQGSEVDVEGCLSIPDITDKVERPFTVSVAAFDLQGREQLIQAEGLEARALQHEIDHLDGILFTDHLIGLRRERARRRLKRLQRDVVEVAS
jgi:peptide deformylase